MRTWPSDFIDKVICGDCLEILKEIPDGSVDLVVTDPPYGIGLDYGDYEDSKENMKRLICGIMPELTRVSKRILLTCGTRQLSWWPEPTWVLCWSYAPTTNKLCPWGFNQWQPILAYGADPYLEKGLGSRPDFIEDRIVPERNHNHPCPKPLSFIKKLILRGSLNESDLILDPFLGSGTTAVAAKQLGRHFIGIEINQAYVDIANERLKQEVLDLKTGQG